MPIIRIQRKESGFALIPNCILEDERLSFEARGMLCYLLSRPANWIVRVQDLINRSGTRENGKPISGRDKVQGCLSELQEAGYAALESTRDESGKMAGRTWVVYEDPKQNPAFTDKPKNGTSAATDSPIFRSSEKPTDGETAHIAITDSLENTDLLNSHSHAREEKISFADPVLGTAAKENPPVAPPPPFEPELAIVAKLDPGPNSQSLERWCMKANATAPEVQATFYDFAAWWIAKEGKGLSDTSIQHLIQNTGATAFRAAFERSFITNFHRFKQQNANGQATGSRPEQAPHDGLTESERIIKRLASERAAIANRRATSGWPPF